MPDPSNQSWRFHEFGHISNLHLEDAPHPVRAPGEDLVKIEYAALNPADIFLVMGRYPGAGTPPFAVGRDGCGRIVEIGPDSPFAVGDYVVFIGATVGITRDGTLAEYVAMPQSHLAPLPDWWSPMDGAAGTKVFLTSWQAVSDAAHLQSGETVVVTGATGGVGLATLALAKAMGATTIALSRSPEKGQKLLALGADHVLETGDSDIVQKTKELGGADVVIEAFGGDFFAKSMAMCNDFGRICVIGALQGTSSEINPLDILFKRLQIHGIQVSMYTEAESSQAFRDLCAVLEPTKAKLAIDRVFPFREVQDAIAHMRRGVLGKIVIGPIPQ